MKSKSSTGFSLVELLVVVALIGILSSIGIVTYTGVLSALKRFKDDVKEVSKGYDCGLQVKDYKDLKIGDQIEAFVNVAIKKKI